MLVDGDDHLDEHLAAALAAHQRLAQPFELARTQLCGGEQLRRARRRADARRLLAEAQATFAALGAEQWATRAASELRAAGDRRGAGPRSDEVLTARERDVCNLVADGATNREAAAALHMSPRTVEHHLRMAYRKLGVRSRTEMTGQFRRL
jgi:DNA-binding CsgD family transcriptional regulator